MMTQNNLAVIDNQAIPEGYKKTEVGIIPNDWETPKFGEICTLINGRGFKPYEWSKKGLPIIRIQNLNGSDDFNYYEGAYDPKIFIENGQLLFAWSGSRGTSFGPHIWKGQNALLNYHTWKLNINHSKVDDKYFYHILKSLTKIIENSAHGASALVHTQKGEMEQFNIPLPPSRIEQEKIATALSDTDALISELEKLIEKKQAIKTATMQQLLTGKTRLPEFALREDGTPKAYKDSELGQIPEGWEVKKLSEITTYINDGTHYTPNYVKNGIPFYSVENVSSNDFENVKYITNEEHQRLLKRCRPERGDILLTRIGTLAKTRLIDWDIDASIYVSLALIKLNKNILSSFVYAFTKTDIFMREVEKRSLVNATPQKINMDEIKNVPILISSDMKEQVDLANIYLSLEADLNKLTKQLSKLENIKVGMMQEILTGKTRLV